MYLFGEPARRYVLHADVWSAFAAERSARSAERLAQSAARVDQQRRMQEQAQQWLLDLLPRSEQDRYRAERRFEVTGSAGGLYEIHHGYSGNIFLMRPERRRYCAHPPITDAPVESAMVAQYLAISTDERAFLRVAYLA